MAVMTETKTLIQVLRLAEGYLDKAGVPGARLSAELLLASVLGLGRLELYLSYDRPLAENELEAYRALLRRRAAHEPVQYILGRTGFRELDVLLGPGALVPRSETELLVQLVLDRLDEVTRSAADQGRDLTLRVLDLCTGAGVVGLSLAAEREGLWCLLADISYEALKWAQKNYEQPGVRWRSNRVSFLCSDLAGPLTMKKHFFHVVTANPPYVGASELESLPEEIKRYEPVQALIGGGADGAGTIGRIIGSVFRVMACGGLLAMEIGETQGPAVRALFAGHKEKYTEPELHCDLAGKIRYVTVFRK